MPFCCHSQAIMKNQVWLFKSRIHIVVWMNYIIILHVGVLITQLCLTLCDLMDCSLPVFPVHGILQARILEWVAISFSRISSQPRDRTQVSLIAGRCWKVVAEPQKYAGIIGLWRRIQSGARDEWGLIAQSFCVIKVLLKYKGNTESFWHRHQKRAERAPPCKC